MVNTPNGHAKGTINTLNHINMTFPERVNNLLIK